MATKPAAAPGGQEAKAQDGAGTRGRLLLLDGHSLAYRAFFALPAENFSTTTGQPTNAVYGFTAMLINVLRDEQPTHVAVAFDRSEPTFRHEQYVEYKANRRETPEDFRSQLSLIFEVLDALGIARLSVPGYEADDVIATLATRAENDGMDVLIVTGDRDVLQLVDDHVTVLMTRRGISDMSRFTPETVEEKYGLTPQQYPDFAAIRGDPSDNLPGIPGVGEKTATKWVREFGSLDGPRQPGRRGQGQGRRRAAGAPRRCAAQPADDRAGPGRSAGRHRHRPRRAGAARLGPGADPPALRHPAVPRAARAALRHAARWHLRRRGR